jgi:excisionase family DNA binding protein
VLLTTKETAEQLGVGLTRVHQLIREGRLPARRLGRDWFIQEKDLALVKDRKPGRPPLASKKKKT